MFHRVFKVYEPKSKTYKTTKVSRYEFLFDQDKPIEERECYKRALGLSTAVSMI